MRDPRKIISILLLLSTLEALGQFNYDIKLIPTPLLENSNVVIRNKEAQFKILSASNASFHSLEAITIFNSKGREHAIKAIYYDRLTKVTQLKASVYDGNGILVKKLKASDFEDRSAISGFSLYEDNRVKVADLSSNHYPFTIELEYELEYKFLFYIPIFYPIWDEHMSAERAKFTINYPLDYKPRTVLRNIEEDKINIKYGNNETTWSFQALEAFERESHGPGWSELLPIISSAPTNFEYEGYVGNMSTWNNFGEWIMRLNKGKDELSNQTKIEIHKLTDGLTSIEDKSKVLYEFLQRKTRYVSIQLGIGGFQPFNAKVVDEVGYGDCKALSNYMITLLKEVGVKANYTLIRAGSNAQPMDIAFPSSQFNHVIVSVPNGVDTLWLECTSQTNPFKYLGTFTGDRHALAITDEGAKIVRTPSGEENNLLQRNLQVKIDETGSAIIVGRAYYQGLQFEKDNLNFISNSNQNEQRKWIEESIDLPSFRIENFKFENASPKIPQAVIEYNIITDRLATVSGKRIFLTPNITGKFPVYYIASSSRKSDVIINKSIVEYDTVHFEFPEYLHPEFTPENKSISNAFGQYEVNFIFSEGKMIYCRKLILKKGRYSVDVYNELSAFNKEITKADNLRLAFLKKT